jgi:hypothetical protein
MIVPPVARRTAAQLARRRRVEELIRLAAPVLDLVLAAGDRVSRVAGRGQEEPEPARRLRDARSRTTIGGPPGAL